MATGLARRAERCLRIGRAVNAFGMMLQGSWALNSPLMGRC